MTIHIGITGTRRGWSAHQNYEVQDIFERYWDEPDDIAFHHGDCVGVDAQAHDLALGFKFETVIHPPISDRYRAFCDGDYRMAPKPYLERNQDIVNAVSLLIVVPEGSEADHPRSGTWATYRMAVRAGVETVVILP
jgi:hypothetical protein